MSLPILFSVIFLAAFAVYVLLGIYTVSLNPRRILNRLFFAFCAALGIWSLGYSMAATIPDYETAMLCHRLAALGWCTLFSFQLHFVLLMTGKKQFLQNNP